MSFFGSIVDKIVQYAGSVLDPAATAAPTPAASVAPTGSDAAARAASPTPAPSQDPGQNGSAAPASLRSVDVGAVLTALDARKGGGLNWQTSIVDLLKLLDLDSSLAARKTLAGELGVHAGADGSAEQNTALHAAVVSKLAENGGTVPASMRG